MSKLKSLSNFRFFPLLQNYVSGKRNLSVSSDEKKTFLEEIKKGQHITDEKVADFVSNFLLKNGEKTNRIIFEASPGPGLLTKHLLDKKSLQEIVLFETRKEYVPILEELCRQHSNLKLIQQDIFSLPLLSYKYAYYGRTDVLEILSEIPESKWTKDPPVTIVGYPTTRREGTFLGHLLSSVPYFDSVFTNGRSELLLFLSGKQYNILTASPKEKYHYYVGSSVLYQILFEIKMIEKFPLKCFQYLPPKKGTKRKQSYDTEHAYLVQLSPRKDLKNEDGKPVPFLPDLQFFVKQHLFKRSALVIPALEKWIPNCGPILIKKGLPFFTKFGDLTPEDILLVFKEFVGLPDYPDSTFKAALLKGGSELYQGAHNLEELNETFS